MKKLLFCLSLAMASGTLVSCRKDEAKPTTQNNSNFNKKDLIESGAWILTKKIVISGDTGKTTTYISGNREYFYDEYSKEWYDDTGFVHNISWDHTKKEYLKNQNSEKYEIIGNTIRILGAENGRYPEKKYLDYEVIKFEKGKKMVLKCVDFDDDELNYPNGKPDEVYRTYEKVQQ